MKHLLLTAIAAVMLVGCGNPEANRALLDAAEKGNIEAVKQHLDAGADVNAKDRGGQTPLDLAIQQKKPETTELLRKHGGKTKKELASS
jgi:ankyrin repeat protein